MPKKIKNKKDGMVLVVDNNLLWHIQEKVITIKIHKQQSSSTRTLINKSQQLEMTQEFLLLKYLDMKIAL